MFYSCKKEFEGQTCWVQYIPVDLTQKILVDVFGKKLGAMWRALLIPLMTVTVIVMPLMAVTPLMLLYRPGAIAACQAQPTWKGLSNISWWIKLLWYMTLCCALSGRSVVWGALQTSLQPKQVKVSMLCWSEKSTITGMSFQCLLTNFMNLFKSNSVWSWTSSYWQRQVPLQRAVLFLEIPESKWLMINTKQRTKHHSQVQSTQVAEASKGSSQFDASDPATSEPAAVTNPVLSVDLESASKQVNTLLKCLEGIWMKGSQLIGTNDSIVPAPGQDSGARMILSYSGKVPHTVTSKKGGEFSCNSSCLNWKSIGNLCI